MLYFKINNILKYSSHYSISLLVINLLCQCPFPIKHFPNRLHMIVMSKRNLTAKCSSTTIQSKRGGKFLKSDPSNTVLIQCKTTNSALQSITTPNNVSFATIDAYIFSFHRRLVVQSTF